MKSILTVLTPATTHDLTTIETIKDELDITDALSDVRLYRWISEASGFVESYCDRVFAAEVLSEQWRDVYVWDPLILRRRPVSTITSITVDDVVLDAAEYEHDPETGMVWRLSGGRMCWSAAKIVIVYTAGYALMDSLPYGVELACIETIKHRSSARSRDPNLRAQTIPGELEQQWWVPGANESGIPPAIKAMLDPYRDIRA